MAGLLYFRLTLRYIRAYNNDIIKFDNRGMFRTPQFFYFLLCEE